MALDSKFYTYNSDGVGKLDIKKIQNAYANAQTPLEKYEAQRAFFTYEGRAPVIDNTAEFASGEYYIPDIAQGPKPYTPAGSNLTGTRAIDKAKVREYFENPITNYLQNQTQNTEANYRKKFGDYFNKYSTQSGQDMGGAMGQKLNSTTMSDAENKRIMSNNLTSDYLKNRGMVQQLADTNARTAASSNANALSKAEKERQDHLAKRAALLGTLGTIAGSAVGGPVGGAAGAGAGTWAAGQ